MVDACVRRLGVVEGNIRVLNDMNTQVMGRMAELEGHVDDAADMIQDVQRNPRGPRQRQNVGHDAFAPSVSSGVRADSRANRRPISLVREWEDSRNRRCLRAHDRSHSPPRRARDGPQGRARADVSVSQIGMKVETGVREQPRALIGSPRRLSRAEPPT